MDFFIQFNLYLVCPIIVFGILFHIISMKSETRLQQLGWGWFVLFGFIGTPIHELSHLLMAILFRYKITDIRLFRPIKGKQDGCLGYVNYTYNNLSFIQNIGNFFVGIAPMIGGSFVIYILFRILLNPLYLGLQSLEEFNFETIKNVILSTNYNMPSFILFLFLAIAISMHMSISKQDLKGATYGIVWLEIAIFGISQLIEFTSISISLIPITIILISILCIGLLADIITYVATDILVQ